MACRHEIIILIDVLETKSQKIKTSLYTYFPLQHVSVTVGRYRYVHTGREVFSKLGVKPLVECLDLPS